MAKIIFLGPLLGTLYIENETEEFIDFLILSRSYMITNNIQKSGNFTNNFSNDHTTLNNNLLILSIAQKYGQIFRFFCVEKVIDKPILKTC